MPRNSLLLILALTACSKKDPGTPAIASGSAPAGSAAPVGSAAGSATPSGSAASATAKPTAGPRGRAAADSRKALVDLATANEACKIDPAYPGNSCTEQVKAFTAAFDREKDLPTLVNLVEDPAAPVRFLAIRVFKDLMLLQQAPARALSTRITAAAAAETDVATASLFGDVLLEGDFKDATYAAAIESLLTTHALPAMRASVASNLAVQDEAHWLPILFARYAAEHDKSVKLAILGAMYTARDAAKICPFLLDAMKDPDNDLAGKAGYDLVWSNGTCKDSYDAFVAAYTAHIAATMPDFQFVLSTAYMAQAKGASPEQIAKFKDATKPIVADAKVSGMARAKALETIADPAFAKGYLKDPDRFVADAAKRLAK